MDGNVCARSFHRSVSLMEQMPPTYNGTVLQHQSSIAFVFFSSFSLSVWWCSRNEDSSSMLCLCLCVCELKHSDDVWQWRIYKESFFFPCLSCSTKSKNQNRFKTIVCRNARKKRDEIEICLNEALQNDERRDWELMGALSDVKQRLVVFARRWQEAKDNKTFSRMSHKGWEENCQRASRQMNKTKLWTVSRRRIQSNSSRSEIRKFPVTHFHCLINMFQQSH